MYANMPIPWILWNYSRQFWKIREGGSKYRPHPSPTKQVGSMATHLGALNILNSQEVKHVHVNHVGNFSRYLGGNYRGTFAITESTIDQPLRAFNIWILFKPPMGHRLCLSDGFLLIDIANNEKGGIFWHIPPEAKAPGFLTGRAGPLQTRILDFRKDVWSKGWWKQASIA